MSLRIHPPVDNLMLLGSCSRGFEVFYCVLLYLYCRRLYISQPIFLFEYSLYLLANYFTEFSVFLETTLLIKLFRKRKAFWLLTLYPGCVHACPPTNYLDLYPHNKWITGVSKHCEKPLPVVPVVRFINMPLLVNKHQELELFRFLQS